MAKDYRGFEDAMKGDVGKAALQVAAVEGGGGRHGGANHQKLRLRGSDLPGLIPAGSVIVFEAVAYHKLKFGDILFMRFDKELCLRRFIRLANKRDGSTDLYVTSEGPNNMVQILPSNALVGKVVGVEDRNGVASNPLAREGVMQRLKNKWTDLGTTTPVEKFTANLSFFMKMLKK